MAIYVGIYRELPVKLKPIFSTPMREHYKRVNVAHSFAFVKIGIVLNLLAYISLLENVSLKKICRMFFFLYIFRFQGALNKKNDIVIIT
jgi:hypothetical protein